MTDLEKTFEYAKDAIRLSDTEKALVREQLIAVMQDRPMAAPVASPVSGTLFPAFLRYGAVVALFLVAGTGGIAYAASNAGPTDTLYAVKVKVNEPVQVALTLDPKERADLEVRLVNQRLKEVAEASVDAPLTPSQAALVTDSLASQIDNAQEDISSLQESQQADDALATASDLAATLNTHAAILGKVREANPAASSTISAIVSTVVDELSETAAIVDTAQDVIESGTATTSLEAPADAQAAETSDALAGIREQVSQALASFDASDRQDVNDALADIQQEIADAQAKDVAGDSKAAYLLYTDADQKLTALKLTIEADQTLNIDVIDATTTDTGM